MFCLTVIDNKGIVHQSITNNPRRAQRKALEIARAYRETLGYDTADLDIRTPDDLAEAFTKTAKNLRGTVLFFILRVEQIDKIEPDKADFLSSETRTF